MAITHGNDTRDAVANAVVDRLDLGTGTTEGRLVILTAADAILASLPLSNPAFDAAGSAGGNSTGTATADPITTTNASGNGTAAKFEMRDRDGNKIFGGSVTATGGGGDLILTNTSIASGDPISITSFTYSAPA